MALDVVLLLLLLLDVPTTPTKAVNPTAGLAAAKIAKKKKYCGILGIILLANAALYFWLSFFFMARCGYRTQAILCLIEV